MVKNNLFTPVYNVLDKQSEYSRSRVNFLRQQNPKTIWYKYDEMFDGSYDHTRKLVLKDHMDQLHDSYESAILNLEGHKTAILKYYEDLIKTIKSCGWNLRHLKISGFLLARELQNIYPNITHFSFQNNVQFVNKTYFETLNQYLKHPVLKHVRLYDLNFTKETTMLFANVMKCAKFQSIELVLCKFDCDFNLAIGDVIFSMTELTTLYMNACKGIRFSRRTQNILKNNFRLRSLMCSMSKQDFESIRNLIMGLKINTSVQNLDLCTKINNNRELHTALENYFKKCNLKHLSYRNDPMSYLQFNLKSLNINNLQTLIILNEFREEADADLFLDTLAENTSIKKLNLNFGFVPLDNSHLRDMLIKNTTVQHLKLEINIAQSGNTQKLKSFFENVSVNKGIEYLFVHGLISYNNKTCSQEILPQSLLQNTRLRVLKISLTNMRHYSQIIVDATNLLRGGWKLQILRTNLEWYTWKINILNILRCLVFGHDIRAEDFDCGIHCNMLALEKTVTNIKNIMVMANISIENNGFYDMEI